MLSSNNRWVNLILKFKSLFKLDELAGEGWRYLEPETLSDILEEPLSDMVFILALISEEDMYSVDPLFFIQATKVLNSNTAELEVDNISMPNSLEVGLGIVLHRMLRQFTGQQIEAQVAQDVYDIIKIILIDEGYSTSIWPLPFIKGLCKGQTPEDILDKETAMKTYISTKLGIHNK